MKTKLISIIPAALIGGLCSYLNALVAPLIIVILMMIIDYITGITAAWLTDELSSRTGIVGIVKKVGSLCLIVVGGAVDFIITTGVARAGIEISTTYAIGLIVCIWIIINECISILENLDEIGVPVPAWLLKVIKHLKTAAENNVKTPEEDEK